MSEGAVDPSLGNDLTALGYDRDFTEVLLASSSGPITTKVRRRILAWQDIRLEGDLLRVPAPLRLDLGATAKAVAADLAAQRIAEELSSGVLVSLGGDIATAGPGPLGWVASSCAGPR
ncbi:FAD:protein FMN transferase [Arthrobacter psychrolactophilus]